MAIIYSDLKPLYAALKELSIGSFLQSERFTLYSIKNNFDEEWREYVLQASESKAVLTWEYSDNSKYEQAFLKLLNDKYLNLFANFSKFLFPILREFTIWSNVKLDFTQLINTLKKLDINKDYILDFIKEMRTIQSTKPQNIVLKNEYKPIAKDINLDLTKVFIVHGHDDAAKSEVARFIEKLKLTPIILHEQASSGNTIIEKIEEHSNVGFGVVLYTPCDFGGKNDKKKEENPRARQNVIFEHGFLIGKIGRKNVCALVKGEVETPNDISGVVYVNMTGSWQIDVAKELRKAGYPINMNLL